MSAPAAGQQIDRDKTRNTVLWGVGLAMVTRAGTTLLSLLLVRLISPEMYGQYGTVSSVTLFVLSFSMQRFTEHLFFQREPDREEHERHLSFGLIRAL
jgi:predicted tellurium resistance membrane protein TerC